jgi:hypothetical protein
VTGYMCPGNKHCSDNGDSAPGSTHHALHVRGPAYGTGSPLDWLKVPARQGLQSPRLPKPAGTRALERIESEIWSRRSRIGTGTAESWNAEGTPVRTLTHHGLLAAGVRHALPYPCRVRTGVSWLEQPPPPRRRPTIRWKSCRRPESLSSILPRKDRRQSRSRSRLANLDPKVSRHLTRWLTSRSLTRPIGSPWTGFPAA